MRKFGFGLLFLVGLVTSAAAQAYELQQGDSIRIVSPGIPNGDWVALVDTDGMVRFPYVGEIKAAELTLEEVQDKGNFAYSGQKFVVFGPDGVRREAFFGEVDIFVSIAAYRDVTVSGAVANPGPVPFTPGMTVRSVLAFAGGTGALEQSAVNVPRLMADFGSAAAAEAQELAELWRLDALLQGEPIDLPAYAHAISDRLGDEQIDRTRDRIDLALAAWGRDRYQLEEQIDPYDQRIAYLEETLANYEEAARLEEEELESIRALFQRGVASRSRLAEVRRSSLVTTTRMLETEANLVEARIARGNLAKELGSSGDEIRERLLAERSEAQFDLTEIRSRFAGLRSEIEAAGLSAYLTGPDRLVPRVIVYRNAKGEPTELTVAMDSPVLPGDVLEVTLEPLSAAQ